jgi:hypothetical protein
MSVDLSVDRTWQVRTLGPVVLLMALAAPILAAGEPTVLSSTREEIHFSLDLGEPQWQAGPRIDGDPTWELRIDGCVSMALPGQIRTPRQGGWLVIPPGTTPRLEVVNEDWQPLDGRRLMRASVPVMQRDPVTDEVFEQPWLPRPGFAPPLDQVPASVQEDMRRPDPALAAGPAVTLGEVSWWRGRRIVSYAVQTVRASADARAQRVLAGGEWRIRFVDDPAAGKDAPVSARQRRSARGDDRFAGFFLNADQVTRLPLESTQLGSLPPRPLRPRDKAEDLGHPQVRILVNRTQLYRVRASQLLANGLLPAEAVAENAIRLYQRRYVADLDDPAEDLSRPYVEVEVPIHVVGEGDSFDGDDLFLFWAQRPRDDGPFNYTVGDQTYALDSAGDDREIANEDNVYWLQLATPTPGQPWARMEQVGLPPSDGTPEETYRRIDYYEAAQGYRENIPGITMDRYYYNTVLDYTAEVPLNFKSPQPDQTGAVLQAGISGHSNSNRNLRMDLLTDGSVVHTLPNFSIATRYERIYETALPASVLFLDDLTFRMRNAINNFNLFSYLDWVRVEYDALYETPLGRLQFPGGDETSIMNLEIPGFNSDDVGLVEVTDPRQPRFVALTRSNLLADGDGYLLSLQVDQTGGQREFYAAVRMTSDGVPDIRYTGASGAEAIADPVIPTQLLESAADVIVVTHPAFREGAEQWVEYRRQRSGGDLTFQVVEPQDLYDWYSGGLKSPWAIKRLANHALASPAWGTWALVIFGDANENPRMLGVTGNGQDWARDWVPTHHHIQTASSNLAPEVLASDKWYGNPDAGDSGFPETIPEPADLYVGRIACNNAADVELMLTKIQQVENASDGQSWRRRGIFIADDAWSSSTLAVEGTIVTYQPSEMAFENSESYMGGLWTGNAGLVTLEADTVLLRPFMDPLHPDIGDTVELDEARNWCETSGAPGALIAALSNGGLIAHYQGHANHWLLCHEIWFQDDDRSTANRDDVDLLQNAGRPWVFYGMGCHLGDFIQNVGHPSGNVDPNMGEKFLFNTSGGASAVYGSSGYEYLNSNEILSRETIRIMTQEPPHIAVDGAEVTSRWLLGEVMWAAEASVLSLSQSSTNRRMVYQYAILGDPLMVLDCGPPEFDAVLEGEGGGDIAGEVDLPAVDASNQRTITLRARDEAGIDRLLVLDSTGQDLTGQTVVETPYYDNGSRQIIDYQLTLPVRPFDHDLLVHLYDSAAPPSATDGVVLTLHVVQDQTTIFTADGETLDPTTYTFTPGEPVDFETTVSSAAWFDEETVVTVTGQNVELSAVSHSVLDAHTLQVAFTATASESKAERGVDLTIDGFNSYIELETTEAPPTEIDITGLVNFPNPMREGTKFVFGTGLHGGRGKVRVWTVSGRYVAEVPFALAGTGQEVVSWNGRDREGDQLANGTYLYRVEIDSAAGLVSSGMQRLVIMR